MRLGGIRKCTDLVFGALGTAIFLQPTIFFFCLYLYSLKRLLVNSHIVYPSDLRGKAPKAYKVGTLKDATPLIIIRAGTTARHTSKR
jgi:hypothetical protein